MPGEEGGKDSERGRAESRGQFSFHPTIEEDYTDLYSW